jgi:predicted nucleotidyltransferase
MSVLSYLTELSSTIKISDWERNSIDISINTLSTKLGNYYSNIESKFVFGSYDRKTILRRSKDSNSDVDFMVVFTDGNEWTPQTLMNRLKRFAEANYSKNEIYQSSPTIVLELSHIKFELIPAWSTYNIPAPSSSFTTWIGTYPHTFKGQLNDKNKDNNYKVRKLIRLLKYWNVLNNKVYSSFELEKYVIDKHYFFCINLKDYFFQAVEGLPTFSLPEYKKTKVDRLKNIIKETKENERQGWNTLAEIEINKVFT